MRYDPEVAPDPIEWLATTEADRLAAVRRHHHSAKHDTGSLQLHAAIHVAVETQLAERHPAATAAMNGLTADGLRRHEDPHAYSRKLQHLKPAAWRAGE